MCDELDQSVLEVLRHRLRHAPIEDDELAVARSQQVAGVRIAMQAARVEQHRQVRIDGDAAEPRHIGRRIQVEARA